MKKYAVTVGIDVSKSKLDFRVVLDGSTANPPHFIVANSERGVKEMISLLKKEKIVLANVLFCFENTGIYSMPLAIYFSRNQLDYWEIPAIEIKRSKGLVRGKNDKTDALDIAFYGITHLHKLQLCSIAEDSILKLQ